MSLCIKAEKKEVKKKDLMIERKSIENDGWSQFSLPSNRTIMSVQAIWNNKKSSRVQPFTLIPAKISNNAKSFMQNNFADYSTKIITDLQNE